MIYVFGFPFLWTSFFSKIAYIADISLSTVIPNPLFVISPGLTINIF